MAANPRRTNIEGALSRVVPLPNNICCPTCKIGETVGGEDIFAYVLARAGGSEAVNNLLNLVPYDNTAPVDSTFSGFLELYQEYVSEPDGLIEAGTFNGGSSLDKFIGMVEKLFFLQDRLEFLNAILDAGFVVLCIGGQGYAMSADKAYQYLNDKAEVIISEDPINCYLATYSNLNS